MGMTSVSLKVKNISDPKKIFTGNFLVDSGAQFTVLPLEVWKKLDLKPEMKRQFSLADGKVITRKIGNAFIEFEDDQIATQVVLGEKDDSFLLGVMTLEALGLGLDPFRRKLYKAHFML